MAFSAPVASFAEAWIETSFDMAMFDGVAPSRLLRGGVDRNPFLKRVLALRAVSPPSRRRGSKQRDFAEPFRCAPGRLLRGGVDRNSAIASPGARGAVVASFAEAWIETELVQRG